MFGGYTSFLEIEKYRAPDRIPRPVGPWLTAAAAMLPYSAYGKNHLRMLGAPSSLARYFELHTTPYFLRQRVLQPEWMMEADVEFLARTLPDSLTGSGDDVMTQAMYFEATAQLTGDMLVKVDRASMAASLEVRCPMLDHVLAELATAIPYPWKLRNGAGKRILIEALGDRLPAPSYSVSSTTEAGADFVRRTSCTISRRPGARTTIS